MQLYKELNIIEDEKLYIKINLFSIVVLVVTAIAVSLVQFMVQGEFRLSFSNVNFFWVFGLFLVSLPIHELFHGLFFKAFSKSGKVKYGFSKGMLYASNPGEVYTKRKFIIIILAPFVFNSLLFLLIPIFGLNSSVFWFVFILHTSGCGGDFWFIYEMIKKPAITYCEDTPVGVKFFVDE